jgi:hypothetical protein
MGDAVNALIHVSEKTMKPKSAFSGAAISGESYETIAVHSRNLCRLSLALAELPCVKRRIKYVAPTGHNRGDTDAR